MKEKLKGRSKVSELRRAVRAECRRQLEQFFAMPDPDGTGLPMLDVLTVHVAKGYGISVGVEARHPLEPGRVAEDPAITQAAQDPTPKPLIEVVKD